MNNFRFTKIIAGVSPALAKETVLSKVINMVDAFRISLSRGYDDNNKKYIDTLMKLDNSKTIILETKGIDTRIKNTSNIPVKKGEKRTVEYSEYAQDGTNKIYIDYSRLERLKTNTLITCQQSQVILKVKNTEEDLAEVEIVEAGRGEIFQYDRIRLDELDNSDEEISEQDQKDILRGLEYGAHVLALSCANSAEHVTSLKEFLDANNASGMKIFAKIETKAGIKNLNKILEIADGTILVFDEMLQFITQEELIEKIKLIKDLGKPVLLAETNTDFGENYNKHFSQQMKDLAHLNIDGVMLETFINEDEVFGIIEQTGDILVGYEEKRENLELKRFYESGSFEVRDYIIYNAFRSINELEIKTAICFTENGYTASRFSSLGPRIPIITFTQSKDTYRYLSLVWGVRGYKISQSFNYGNLKKIGKEMIRMIFKGNISLDDKILILQANEAGFGEKNDMINGVEFYNFKNI